MHDLYGMKTPSPEKRERARGFGSPKKGSTQGYHVLSLICNV
jgi:hypothetical protein